MSRKRQWTAWFKEGETTSRRGSLPSPDQPESLLALRSAGAAYGGGPALTGDAASPRGQRKDTKRSDYVVQAAMGDVAPAHPEGCCVALHGRKRNPYRSPRVI